MSSWRPLVAGTVGLFLIILAFLSGQLHAGADPVLRTSGSTATAQPTPQATANPQDGSGFVPSGPGSAPDGSTPDLSPPTTHQS